MFRPVRLVVSLAVLGLPACRAGSASVPPRDADTRAIASRLDQLYRAFCFDAGGEPDWNAIREISLPGAAFVAPIAKGTAPRAVGIEEFLSDFRAYVASEPARRTGVHERIANARIEAFGSIAHAWVVFEATEPGTSKPPRRGLDSLELVLDGGRWRVASFTTQYESDALPLDRRFLSDAR